MTSGLIADPGAILPATAPLWHTPCPWTYAHGNLQRTKTPKLNRSHALDISLRAKTISPALPDNYLCGSSRGIRLRGFRRPVDKSIPCDRIHHTRERHSRPRRSPAISGHCHGDREHERHMGSGRSSGRQFERRHHYGEHARNSRVLRAGKSAVAARRHGHRR